MARALHRNAVRASFGLALALLSLLLGHEARANEATGSFTGAVETRGNYYWEQSTRVVAPSIGVDLEAPNGVRVHADYLVDSITSASLAAGTVVDVAFTEIRHDGSLGLGYEFDLGKAQLDVSGMGRYSYEPDYTSRSGAVNTALSLFERATVLRFGASYILDDVGRRIRGANRTGADGRNLSDRGKIGELEGFGLNVAWDQVLSPVLTAQIGYDFGHLSGFLANAYRRVVVDGVPLEEAHPNRRLRHTAYGRLAYFVPWTRSSIHLMFRGYLDTWKIAAITPEVRIYQELGRNVLVRLRYRYYDQTAAFFYRDGVQDLYVATDRYYTADPKMSDFLSHLAGMQVVMTLGFLEGTAFDFASRFSVDFSFDHLWQTNRFGDAVIAQMGLRMPF